jgi:hypothetical protein
MKRPPQYGTNPCARSISKVRWLGVMFTYVAALLRKMRETSIGA